MNSQYVYLLIILGFVMPACAPKAPEYTEVEDTIAPYFSAFKTEAEARGISLNLSRFRIAFDSSLSNSNHAGKCTISEVQTGTIIAPGRATELVVSINPTIFQKSNEYGKLEIVFHELGHCLLGYSHNDKQISIMTNSGIKSLPSSFMSTYHFSDSINKTDQDLLLGYYINQLFSPTLESTDLSQITTLQAYKINFSKSTLLKMQDSEEYLEENETQSELD